MHSTASVVFYLVFYQLGYKICSRCMPGLDLLQMLAGQASRGIHGYVQPYCKDVRPTIEYYVSSFRVLPDIELGEGSAIPFAVGRKTVGTSHKNQPGQQSGQFGMKFKSISCVGQGSRGYQSNLTRSIQNRLGKKIPGFGRVQRELGGRTITAGRAVRGMRTH